MGHDTNIVSVQSGRKCFNLHRLCLHNYIILVMKCIYSII